MNNPDPNISQPLNANGGQQRVLVTGAAGFIGMHTCEAYCKAGYQVAGIDNYSDYYDPQLKKDRIAHLSTYQNFTFANVDISNKSDLTKSFKSGQFSFVINLAAQAGVRYSIDHPEIYIDTNLVGFGNILEACRRHSVGHLIYASSSSVYGRNETVPFSESDPVNKPSSLYAATKRANELMAESYFHLYGLPVTGLRLFTVYGPWGRPDMAYFKFTRLLFEGAELPIFNSGKHSRDMTYITDIVAGIVSAGKRAPMEHSIFNLGNSAPEELMDMVGTLERLTGRQSKHNMLPFQEGDVLSTYANIDAARDALDFEPHTTMAEGLERFVEWFRSYYAVE